jgi:hypothetical protein
VHALCGESLQVRLDARAAAGIGPGDGQTTNRNHRRGSVCHVDSSLQTLRSSDNPVTLPTIKIKALGSEFIADAAGDAPG